MNTREFYENCLAHGFPTEASAALKCDADKLLRDRLCAEMIQNAQTAYENRTFPDFSKEADELSKRADAQGVHPYAAKLLFYLFLLPELHRKYREKGLPERYFDGVVDDLLCKARECREVYGVWGSFVSSWFIRFFVFSLYAIGRLEFCLIPCPFDYREGDLSIKKGEPCIDVHIPSKGRLTKDALDGSYDEAAVFFKEKLQGTPTVFHCESWLLADYHKEMLPARSGIRLFADDYTVLGDFPCEDDLWRIFKNENTEKPQELSCDTRLKRAYRDRLSAGSRITGGIGLFFYENHRKT